MPIAISETQFTCHKNVNQVADDDKGVIHDQAKTFDGTEQGIGFVTIAAKSERCVGCNVREEGPKWLALADRGWVMACEDLSTLGSISLVSLLKQHLKIV